MDITYINLDTCPLQYLSVGYVGETGARPVAFDFSAWATEYGAGVLQLLLQRPGDADPYPVLLDIDGTTATWTPDATATETTGQGQAQLVYTVGGVVVKNAIFRVLIAPSLGAAGDPPEPYEDWLQRLLTIAVEAQQSAIDAAGSAEAAGTSAGAAAGSAGAAAQSALDAEAAKTAAETAENAAGQSAALARTKAAEAAEAAQIAGENADYAQQQRVMAEADAVDAHDSAESAAQSAEDAQAASSAAQTAASAAAASASAAAGSAADAASAVTEVETKGAEQISAVNQAGTTQIAAVDAAGAAQVQAIEDKGEEVIASIPSDYTELADDVSDLKSSLYDPQYGLNQKAGLLRDTAEGAVASFVPDATIDNLLGVSVDIEPVQDLHGYDNPWPAGGGKNKLHNTATTTTDNGVTFTVNADGSVSCAGTATATAVFRMFQTFSITEDIIMNGCPSGGNYNDGYSLFAATGTGSSVTPNASVDIGTGVTIPAQYVSNIAQIQIIARSGTNMNGKVFYPMIRLATETDATFAPYENICPISGWTGVEVQRTGVNVFGGGALADTIVAKVGGASKDPTTKTVSYTGERITGVVLFDKFEPDTQYTAYLSTSSSATNTCFKYTDGTVTYISPNTAKVSTPGKSVMSISGVWMGGKTVLEYEQSGVMKGVHTADDFTPYVGTTYPITFPSEAGTVYGGTLDVTNGRLTVTYAEYVFSGGEIWQASSMPNRFFINAFNHRLPYPMAAQTMVANDKQNVFSSIFGTFAYVNADGVGYIVSSSNSRQLVVNTTAASTIADINSIMTGSQLVYELATPIVIDLDSVAVSTIAGQLNNLWADTGDSYVEFAADLKTYIDSKIAAAVAALS